MIKTTITLLLLSFSSVVYSLCPKFTQEQESLLHLAYSVGEPYDLGWTLSSVVWQESFVGEYVVRINPKDHQNGSYGITMVLLEFVMRYEGVSSVWEGKATLIPKLLTDDVYALQMGVNHLIKDQHRGWRGMVKSYNGSEIYVDKIADKLVTLKKCMKLDEEN